jgi:hypothetical protein
MKLSLPVLALVVATGMPLAACAQQSNAAENGPSPEVRQQMQQLRDTTKTAAFNDLSAADRAKVQAIIDRVNNGQLTDLRAAADQIDAAISPAESKAVLAERDKMMQSMRASFPRRDGMGPGPNGQNGGPGPNGGPGAGAPGPNAGPNGAAPNADHPRGPWGGARTQTAGRFLLSLGVSREKMRELRNAQRPQQQQSQ